MYSQYYHYPCQQASVFTFNLINVMFQCKPFTHYLFPKNHDRIRIAIEIV